jgi:hypothetical protein
VANSRRGRLRIFATAIVVALVAALMMAAVALAFSEQYGFYEIGNNGYVQSAGAHTFTLNFGAGSNGGRLACQLFNSKGANEVAHGNGSCGVSYGGGQFVWARVYNESGVSETVGGEAET